MPKVKRRVRLKTPPLLLWRTQALIETLLVKSDGGSGMSALRLMCTRWFPGETDYRPL